MFAWTLTKAKNPQMWGVAENHTLNQWGYSWKKITKKRIQKLCQLLFYRFVKKKKRSCEHIFQNFWDDLIKLNFTYLRWLDVSLSNSCCNMNKKKSFNNVLPPHPPSLTITSPGLLFPKMLRILHFQNFLKLLYEFFYCKGVKIHDDQEKHNSNWFY